jgi:hypothetical protein
VARDAKSNLVAAADQRRPALEPARRRDDGAAGADAVPVAGPIAGRERFGAARTPGRDARLGTIGDGTAAPPLISNRTA